MSEVVKSQGEGQGVIGGECQCSRLPFNSKGFELITNKHFFVVRIKRSVVTSREIRGAIILE
jgi:hypothetical protein